MVYHGLLSWHHSGTAGYLEIWSAQRSGGHSLGRRHDEGGVQARMSMAWVPGCRRHNLCTRRHLGVVCELLSIVGGCPVRVIIDAFVT